MTLSHCVNSYIFKNTGSSEVYWNALIGVTIPMAVLMVGAFALGFLCGYICKEYQEFSRSLHMNHKHNSGADSGDHE